MKHGYFDISTGAQVDLIHGKPDDNISIITRIVVPKASRGQGHAGRLMRRVTDDADEEGVMLILAVESYDDGLSNDQLIDWYGRMGFIFMRRADFEMPKLEVDIEPGDAGMVMVRPPRRA